MVLSQGYNASLSEKLVVAWTSGSDIVDCEDIDEEDGEGVHRLIDVALLLAVEDGASVSSIDGLRGVLANGI